MNEQYRGFATLIDRAMWNAARSGMSINDMVSATGVPTSTLYRWRRGSLQSPPDPLQVRRLSEGLNVSIDDLHRALGWWDDDQERGYITAKVDQLQAELTEVRDWFRAAAENLTILEEIRDRCWKEQDEARKELATLRSNLQKSPRVASPEGMIEVGVNELVRQRNEAAAGPRNRPDVSIFDAVPVVASVITEHKPLLSVDDGDVLVYSCTCDEWSMEVPDPGADAWLKWRPVHGEHRALAVLTELRSKGLAYFTLEPGAQQPARDITEGS